MNDEVGVVRRWKCNGFGRGVFRQRPQGTQPAKRIGLNRRGLRDRRGNVHDFFSPDRHRTRTTGRHSIARRRCTGHDRVKRLKVAR